MSKFKVGDKVRIKKPDCFRNNMVAVITKTDYESMTGKLGYQIRVGDGPNPDGFVWFDEELELVERKPFTKSDLKDGMVVEYRNGDREVVIGSRSVDSSGFHRFDEYGADLTEQKWGLPKHDIIKVYNVIKKERLSSLTDIFDDYHLEVIWEREEEPEYKEMTVVEIEEKLGYKVKVISDD